MRVPLTWMKEFVDITMSPAELAYRLTVAGIEVSKIEYVGVAPGGPNTFGVSEDPGLAWDRARILVGQIVEVQPHPNADRLVLADVEYGANPGSAPGRGELHRVVTGAPNIFHLKGQGRLADGPKVVFAREGSQLYDGHAEGQKLMTLKPSKIRGIPSNAMVCSEKELGLSEEHEGIIILDADAPVGTPLADYMGDVVLHIEILPNIARCQSIIGVAREVAALTGARFKGTDQCRLGASKPELQVVDASDWVRLQIDAPELCPRYSAALIRGVRSGPSPEWMQRRLRLAGVRAISNIVDITNYVMMEWGQPLHAFDYDKLVRRADSSVPHPRAEGVRPSAEGRATGARPSPSADFAEGIVAHAAVQDIGVVLPAGTVPTISVRRAREGEHLTTLDGTDRALTAGANPEDLRTAVHATGSREPADILLIADTAGAIALAGIMGGAETEIDEHTTNVLLEAAAFNFINNRKSAAALKLPSEATARFGRGVPPAYTISSATRAADLMRQLAQGEPAPQMIDAYPGRQPQTVIHFDTAEIPRLLGIDVPVERITSILKSLDFEVLLLDSGTSAEQGDLHPLAPAGGEAASGDPHPMLGKQPDRPLPSGPLEPPEAGHRAGGPSVLHPIDAGRFGDRAGDYSLSPPQGERPSQSFGTTPKGERPPAGHPQLEITVPEHRLDVAIPADIVEEVARVIGYDQIPPTLMRDELPPQRHNLSLEAEDLVRDIMVGCGLQEVISYPLTTVEREALLFPDPAQAELDPGSYVTIANPISPERKVMRHTLLSSLLDTLREALRHRERVLLFEIGRVYLPQDDSSVLHGRAGDVRPPAGPQSGSSLPTEHTRLTIALAGPREPQSWLRGKRTAPLDFFDIRGIVDTLVRRLHVQSVEFTPSEHPTFHPARSAALSGGHYTPGVVHQRAEGNALWPLRGEAASGDRKGSRPSAEGRIGVFGEIHPKVREHFDLPHDPVCLAEFDLELLRAEMGTARFQKLPRFPAIREDIAVVVDEEVPAAQVEAVIREAGGAMLRSTTLFDLYRGDQVGAGRKSLAYALSYQHDERTLTDDEAAKIRGRIVKKLRDAVGAELRG